MAKNTVKAISFVGFDTGDLVSNTFVFFATTDEPLILVRFVNNSNSNIFISYDGGETEHEVCLGNESVELDFQTNSIPTAKACMLAAGTNIWIKGEPSEGFFGMSGYYQPQN